MLRKEKKSQNDTYNRILNAEKMTPDRLRSFPGFERVDEEEAKHVIETLENYCGIVVKHISKSTDYG